MPARTPVKKAVLVAVHSSPDKPLGKVNGAHADAKKLRDLLINTYQYELKDIKFLLDSKKTPFDSDCYPTRENILEAMRGLVAGKQAGDHIVFSFSGHGGQDDPIDDKNEKDGKDELLMPVDYDSEVVDTNLGTFKYSNFIRDDEIRKIFVDGLAEGVHCTLIFDCCHSGTASDLPEVGDEEDGYKGSPPQRRALGFTQEETRHHEHAASAEASDPDTAEGHQKDHLVSPKEVTSWSACSDKQVTFGNSEGGLFISAFVEILQSEAAKSNIITHQKLLVDLRARLIKDAKVKANLNPTSAPHPQMGSLHPDHIFGQPFTL